jgi:hypothetical protein
MATSPRTPSPFFQVRKSLGDWGSQLIDRQFSDAVVAAGVLEAHQELVYQSDLMAALRDVLSGTEVAVRWERPRRSLEWLPPAVAARAAAAIPVRLQVNPGLGMQSELHDWLMVMTEPERGVSAYVLADGGAGEFSWRWPLRIGILADDARSERLRDELEGSLWWPHLQTLVEARGGCEILLVPWSASEADAIDALPEVSPGLVVVLGPVDVAPAEVARIADRLASRFGAWGCHLAGAPDSNAGWLNAVVEGLSHDDPIDFALKRAEITSNGSGYSALSYRLVADSRLSETIARFADRLSRIRHYEIDVSEEISRLLPGLTISGKVYGGALASYLSDAIQNNRFTFEGESHEATGLAMLVTAAGELPPPEEMATANGDGGSHGGTRGDHENEVVEVRVLNGAVKKDGVDHKLALEAGQTYSLEVWIGVLTSESITQRDAPAVPVDDLPEGPNQIEVVFVCADNQEETQRTHVTLPVTGDSDRAEFRLMITDPGPVLGRIALYYQGRVLQTALFRSDVVVGRASRLGRPEIEVETIVRAGLGGLSELKAFDVAIVVNRNDSGDKAATVIRKDGVTLRSVDGLRPRIDQLIGVLTAVADDPDAFKSLTSEASLDLLFDAATIGEELHQTFVNDHGITDRFFAEGRVQIISATPESYLPVELFYALRAPTVRKLCKSWKKVVLEGTCQPCESRSDSGEIPICPTGFWGVRYVIERHAHDPSFVELAGEYRLQSEPITGRNHIAPLESVVWSMSDKVSPEDRTSLTTTLSEGGFKATQAMSWDDFEEKVGTLDPSMVFLVPHTDQDGVSIGMEIGGGELEPVNRVGVRMREPRTKPVVAVLLGCETANPKIPFQGLVPRFRRAGAAVVISTTNTILGRHAVPVAVELLSFLKSEAAGEAGLGDVLRRLRRKALHDGYPMVLSIVAYGDADWRVES